MFEDHGLRHTVDVQPSGAYDEHGETTLQISDSRRACLEKGGNGDGRWCRPIDYAELLIRQCGRKRLADEINVIPDLRHESLDRVELELSAHALY